MLWYLFLYDGLNVTGSTKSNGKENEFVYNILIICRYLNLYNRLEEFLFRANRKFTSC
jgi:hypothetical protein